MKNPKSDAAAPAKPQLKTKNMKPCYRVSETAMTGKEITFIKPFKVRKKRVWELDFIRGLAILLVAMDHIFYDCFAIFGDIWMQNEFLARVVLFATEYHGGALREFWKPIFLFLFFFVSGISSRFSKNNLFRSLKLIGAALFITGATYILENYMGFQAFVKFGVIHCFAVIVLIYAAIELLVHFITLKHKAAAKFILSALCLAVGITALVLQSRYNVGVMEYELHGKYSNIEWDSPLAGMFFYVRSWWSTGTVDYFPLIPYIGYFMLGAGLTSFLYPNKKSLLPFLDGYQRLPFIRKPIHIGWWHKIFTIPGRFSLFIFIGMQVVAVVLLGLVTLIVFGELPFF